MYSEWKTAWKSELRKVKVKANNTLHILYLSTGRFSLKAVSMFKPSSFRKIGVKITWDKYYHKLAFCNKKKGFFSPFFFFFLFGTKYELICSLSRNLPPWYWEWLSHCGQRTSEKETKQKIQTDQYLSTTSASLSHKSKSVTKSLHKDYSLFGCFPCSQRTMSLK